MCLLCKGSFVDISAFNSTAALAKHLQWLIDNPLEYAKYFAWRQEWKEKKAKQQAKIEIEATGRGSEKYSERLPWPAGWYKVNRIQHYHFASLPTNAICGARTVAGEANGLDRHTM
jgi:hypothetical protein